ncbi:MAG: AmmeMemoRadiSam system protein B, partial [Deltaproteobacteria bacterium]|nr:AmmeMemoRadiSam system protein B [Deltaproteobacteria bacterium]
MIRQPAVANQFYPGDEQSLKREVSARMEEVHKKEKVLAIVSPHAGYVYSGNVAGAVFSVAEIPQDTVVMGPNHHGIGVPYAVMTQGTWQMPGGEVPINERLAALMIGESRYLEADTQAHVHEHSVEVQLPFIQHVMPEASFVPVVLGRADYPICEEIGMAIARALKRYEKPVVLIASTDMTHYESQQSAKEKDQLAIDKISALDPAGLLDTVTGNNISMCGVIPTTITLIAAKEMGATKARLIQYATSGDVSGDYSYVVGYASFIIQ